MQSRGRVEQRSFISKWNSVPADPALYGGRHSWMIPYQVSDLWNWPACSEVVGTASGYSHVIKDPVDCSSENCIYQTLKNLFLFYLSQELLSSIKQMMLILILIVMTLEISWYLTLPPPRSWDHHSRYLNLEPSSSEPVAQKVILTGVILPLDCTQVSFHRLG